VQWPSLNATTTELRFPMINADPARTAVAGAEVSVCATITQLSTCATALASGQTDDAGAVDLSVMTATASVVPTGLTPQVLLTAPGFSRTYGDLTFPLSEAVFTFPPSLSVLFPPSYFALTPGGPLVDLPSEGGPSVGDFDASVATAPYGEVVVYVVDCQGNPAIGVSATAVVMSSPCVFGTTGTGPGTTGTEPGICPTFGAVEGPGSGVALVHVPSGDVMLTVSVDAPPQPAPEGGAKELACCSAAPGAMGALSPGGGLPSTDAADDATSAGSPQDAGGPVVMQSLPGLQFTDGGMCLMQPDGGCAPYCSTEPTCVQPSTGPSLLDGGQIGSFLVIVPDWAVTGVWVVPQPR
jgi:hypothetical protein